jgi:hypothetical protein
VGRRCTPESGGIKQCDDDWPDNWNPSVGKIGVAFARNRQKRVSDARSKVARRVDESDRLRKWLCTPATSTLGGTASSAMFTESNGTIRTYSKKWMITSFMPGKMAIDAAAPIIAHPAYRMACA